MYDKHPFAVLVGGFMIFAVLIHFYDDGITIGSLLKGVGSGFFFFFALWIPVMIIISMLSSKK
jgi:hypothetical protein